MQKTGVFLPGMDDERSDLGRDFLRSPEDFATNHGLDPYRLDCPPEVHEALQRGQKFAEDIGRSNIRPNSESMPTLEQIARQHFGDDFDVALIPFGLKFKERVDMSRMEITGTGSGTVTWLDTDADVDG